MGIIGGLAIAFFGDRCCQPMGNDMLILLAGIAAVLCGMGWYVNTHRE
jgi:hypothetical protein